MNNKYLEELEKRMEENTGMHFDAILAGDNERLEELIQEAKELDAEYDALTKPTADFVGMLGREYIEIINSRSNEDYIVNQPQMNKFLEVLAFIIEQSKAGDCEIKSVTLEPREENAGLTAEYIVFDIWGKSHNRFQEVLKHTTAFSVDATLDHRVRVSLTVPEVFVRNDELDD